MSPEEIERLKRVAKRRFVIALVVGVILATVGYFAGREAKARHNDAGAPATSETVAVCGGVNSSSEGASSVVFDAGEWGAL